MISIYSLSFFGSYFLPPRKIDYSFEATIYFLLLLFSFLMPALRFDSGKVNRIRKVNIKLFNFISSIFIFMGIVTYMYFIPVVIGIFFSGEALVSVRGDVVGGSVLYETGLLYYAITLFCQFFPIILVFYFYSSVATGNSKLFNGLLLFSSTGYILNVLSSVGRDGFVLWTMSYFFAFLLFKNFMNSEQRIKYAKLIKYIIFLFALIFIPITVSRFLSDGDTSRLLFSVLSYFSQQLGNFNEIYNSKIIFQSNFAAIFPIFSIFSDVPKHQLSFLDDYYLFIYTYNIDPNVFRTFLGDFYMKFTPAFLLIIGLLFGALSFIFLAKNKTISLSRILVITLVSQIPLHGIFYYKLAYTVSNIYMILVVLLALLLAFVKSHNFNKFLVINNHD